MYSNILESHKLHRLKGDHVKGWLYLLALANLQTVRGTLPVVGDIAFALRLKLEKAETLLKTLLDAGLLSRNSHGYVIHDS